MLVMMMLVIIMLIKMMLLVAPNSHTDCYGPCCLPPA